MKSYIVSIYTADTKALLQELPGTYSLEEAFALVHRDWIVDRNPQINKGGYWNIHLDNKGVLEFFGFEVPSRPMNDAELAEHKEMLRKAKVKLPDYTEQRPRVSDWAALEGSYNLPNGRIGGLHITATDRQDWMRSR